MPNFQFVEASTPSSPDDTVSVIEVLDGYFSGTLLSIDDLLVEENGNFKFQYSVYGTNDDEPTFTEEEYQELNMVVRDIVIVLVEAYSAHETGESSAESY